jgi:UDP-glucose 4-epimerase
MKAIVTGAAGFIGSHLCEALLAQDWQVCGIDLMTAYYDLTRKQANRRLLQGHPAFTWREADVARLDWQELGDRADVVFHLAAQPGVRADWDGTFPTYVQHNLLATQHLFDGLRRCRRPPRVVYASSSSIYGDAEALPTPETAPSLPVSPYGITKHAAERLGFVYQQAYGIPFTALRYFTVYGPRQRPDMAFCRFLEALRQGRRVSMFGSGRQRRDFTYVQDAVAATVSAGTISGAVGEAINVSGGTAVALDSALTAMERITGRQFAIDVQPLQPGEVRHTCADTTKARRLLGFQPKVNLSDGLTAMWDWVNSLPD